MNVKKLIIMTLLAILLLSTFACGGGGEEEVASTSTPTPTPTPTVTPTPTPTPSPTPTPVAEYLTYTDEVNGFSISYPEGWHMMPEGRLADVVVVGFEGASGCVVSGAGFTVSKHQGPHSVPPLEPWHDATLRAWERRSEEFSLVSQEDLSISGRPAIKAVLIVDKEHLIVDLCLVTDTAGWGITCITPSACWSDAKPIFDTIVESFRLLE